MNAKRRLFIAGFLTAALLVVGSAQGQANKPDKNTKAPDSKVLEVDNVVGHPEKFKGEIGVAGRVQKVEKEKNLFVLGCEDACAAIPVRFSGASPKVGTQIIVRGQITKDANGRYLFEARTVTPKK